MVLTSALKATASEEISMMTNGVGASPQVCKLSEEQNILKADTLVDMAPRVLYRRDMFAERREVAYKNLILFYKELNLTIPNWINAPRAMFMMDGDFVLPMGIPGDRASPTQLRHSERKSADSALFSEHARNGNIQMCVLIAKILNTVVKIEDEKGSGVDGDKGAEDKKLASVGIRKNMEAHKDEEIDFALDDLLTKPELVCNFNTGIIRQPKEPIHQALHVDNKDTVDWRCTQKILRGGGGCSPEEWLKCGYVVDMPMSQEGSWIRLAIPDEKKKTFVMHWVYIPYGSMLIRSMSVFHSGHYGSPGNCRYHATFTVGNTTLDSSKLLYLHGLFHGDKDSDFNEWKLEWHHDVPASCQTANGYEKISWKDAQAQGTAYYDNYIKPMHSNKLFKNILWNLSPYEGLTNIKKKGKVKLGKDSVSKPMDIKMEGVVKVEASNDSDTSMQYGTPEEQAGTV